MAIRSTDETHPGDLHGGQPLVKINREIPLWGILGVVGTLAIHGTTLWFSNQKLTEKVAELTSEVRTLTAANHQAAIDRSAVMYKIQAVESSIDAAMKRVDELNQRLDRSDPASRRQR